MKIRNSVVKGSRLPCHVSLSFSDSFDDNAFENILRKGENICNQHFLLFPCFLPFLENKMSHLYLLSANALNLNWSTIFHLVRCPFMKAEPHSSVGSIVYLRTEGCQFDPQLSQYSFGGLIIVIVTGFIVLPLLSVVSTIVLWESSQWLGKNIVQSSG